MLAKCELCLVLAPRSGGPAGLFAMNEFWLNRGYSNIASSDLYHEMQFWLFTEMTPEKATTTKTALPPASPALPSRSVPHSRVPRHHFPRSISPLIQSTLGPAAARPTHACWPGWGGLQVRGGKLSVIKEGEGGPVISDYSGHLQADQAETKRPESPLPSCSRFTLQSHDLPLVAACTGRWVLGGVRPW